GEATAASIYNRRAGARWHSFSAPNRLERFAIGCSGVTTMDEVMPALFGQDGRQRLPHRLPQCRARPRPHLAQPGLDLRPQLLNRVVVWRVRWQLPDLRPGLGDRPPHRRPLVGRQIVPDHDVARPQRRYQDLLHIGLEGRRVRGSLEHQRGHHPVLRQGRDQGVHRPMPLRHTVDHPLPAQGPAIQAGQGGMGPRLIDKYQAGWVHSGQTLPPVLTLRLHVGPLLLGGVHHFFFTVTPKLARTRWMVLRWTGAPKRSRSSAKVVSGASATKPTKRKRSSSSSLRGAPPAWGRAATEPSWRRRWRRRRIQAVETWKRWASCVREAWPSSQARTTRSRRS